MRPMAPDIQNNASQVPARKQSEWSPEEHSEIIRLRARGIKWEDISKKLPGRSSMSCRLHYYKYLKRRRSDWDENRKNRLARLYQRWEWYGVLLTKQGNWCLQRQFNKLTFKKIASYWLTGRPT